MHNDPNMTGLEQQVTSGGFSCSKSEYALCKDYNVAQLSTRYSVGALWRLGVDRKFASSE